MPIQVMPEPGDAELFQLLQLWNQEYPVQLNLSTPADLTEYLQTLDHQRHWVYTDEHNQIIGWAFTFDRDGERWFAILIDHSFQGKGYGRSMLNQLKSHEPILNGWVIDHDEYTKSNGKPYLSPLGFYKKCGFDVLPDQRLELDILSAVKIRWIRD